MAIDGKGVADLFPALAGSPDARSADPASLIRVVLEGARSVATAGEPTGPGMPSFAWKLSDDRGRGRADLRPQRLGRRRPAGRPAAGRAGSRPRRNGGDGTLDAHHIP